MNCYTHAADICHSGARLTAPATPCAGGGGETADASSPLALGAADGGTPPASDEALRDACVVSSG